MKEVFQLKNFLMVKLIIMTKIKIKQIKSSIKRLKNQKRTLIALGLRGIGKEVIHENSDTIKGMISKVEHLVSVNESK